MVIPPRSNVMFNNDHDCSFGVLSIFYVKGQEALGCLSNLRCHVSHVQTHVFTHMQGPAWAYALDVPRFPAHHIHKILMYVHTILLGRYGLSQPRPISFAYFNKCLIPTPVIHVGHSTSCMF